jgi:hypothetical protein
MAAYEHQKDKSGRPNPKYVDLLDEDKPIANQKFTCMSFISPEKIIKDKQMFTFQKFVKQWDYTKSMSKYVEFLNFVAFKYNLKFDTISEDFKDFVKDQHQVLSSNTELEDDFKTFMDHNEEEIDSEYNKTHDFQTSTRGLKVRGTFPTLEEAELRCKMLREIDPNHDVFVGPVGLWMPWHPEAYKTGRVEYVEDELNQLMHEKSKNEEFAKAAFEKRLKETKQKAIEENIKSAEKTGAMLTQNIDEYGNLIGANDMNTQERNISREIRNGNSIAASVQSALFEGEDIIVKDKKK